MNIILLDSQILVASGLKQLISQIPNMNVLEIFAEGKDALDYLDHHPEVELLISDLSLKDMNGLDVLEQVRLSHQKVKVMILTMHDELNIVANCMQAGADAFLSKKTDIAEMAFAIDRISMGRKYVCSIITSRAFSQKGIIREANADQSAFSDREVMVLKHVGNGLTNQEIAEKMFLSRRTVEGHRQNLLRKTNALNTATLIKFAVSNGLIE